MTSSITIWPGGGAGGSGFCDGTGLLMPAIIIRMVAMKVLMMCFVLLIQI